MEIQVLRAPKLKKFLLYTLLLSGVGIFFSFFTDKVNFAFSYATSLFFFLSLSLGALFFVLTQHLASVSWAVVVRRICEQVATNISWLALLILPLVLFNLHDLFHWTHAEEVAKDPILSSKSGYLNVPFFIIRTLIYFIIWSYLSTSLLKKSLFQDKNGDGVITQKMFKQSTFGMVLFVLSLTFFAFDWIMSLDPHWFSTIFGVYYFACSMVGAFALILMIIFWLHKGGYFKGIITTEHEHDLGKLLFGFNVFWAYIAFSQFMLIWYANLGEETIFYHLRTNGSWKTYTTLLPIIHFVLPFFFLISRVIKRNKALLLIGSVWLFISNYIDIYWLVMPNFSKNGVDFSFHDIVAVIFVGSLFFYVLLTRMEKSPLIPLKDHKLKTAIKFKNF